MKIAIITGASSGLGVEFYRAIQRESIDEAWIIARRETRLNEIKEKFGTISTRVIPMDITAKEAMVELKELLKSEAPDVKFLINNAGAGIYGPVAEAEHKVQGSMIDLNARALTEITTITLPYMSERSFIINTCSIASFVPNANLTVYSSTKAYVMSFSRALRYELKHRRINVTVICPGPMETEFLSVAGLDDGQSRAFDRLPRCNPEKTAIKGIKASKKGRFIYTPRLFYKLYRLLSKILPVSWMMGLAKT